MSSVTIIQIVAGVLFAVVLGVLIQRRHSKVA
jgi:high-affinity Fe2+/Pb2+ permease